MTAEDVIFSWQLLRDKGRPNHRTYYAKVVKAEAIGERAVRFDLAGSDDRELPLILGLMPVLAKHAINPETFEETSIAPPLGSGPYVVGKVDPGKSVTLKRNPDYWGRDLADQSRLLEFRRDPLRLLPRRQFAITRHSRAACTTCARRDDPGRWQTGVRFPALREGRVVKEAFPTGLPKPSFYFVFNTRRRSSPTFACARRSRCCSTSSGSTTAISSISTAAARAISTARSCPRMAGRPMRASERCSRHFPMRCAPTCSMAPGRRRSATAPAATAQRLRRALDLFAAAGYELRGTELVERAPAGRSAFEIMVDDRDEERLALLFAQSLKRAGIAARVRMVDAVQYEARRIAYDFDMIQNRWDQSLSPGNEQAFYWGSAAADSPARRNYMGVKSAAVDAMIAALLKARGRAPNSLPRCARSIAC